MAGHGAGGGKLPLEPQHAMHGHTTKLPTVDSGAAHGKAHPKAEESMTLLVLMDGSTTSEYALETAIDWARGHPRATILLVHAIELVKFTAAFAGIGIEHAAFVDPNIFRNANEALIRRAKELLNLYGKAAKARTDATIKAFALVSDVDSPKDAALKFAAEHHVHTIFVGTRGLGTLQRWFLGSFSSAIVQNAKCDVCVVKVPPPGSHGFPEIRAAQKHWQSQTQPKGGHPLPPHTGTVAAPHQQSLGSGGAPAPKPMASVKPPAHQPMAADPAYQHIPTEESLSDRLARMNFKNG